MCTCVYVCVWVHMWEEGRVCVGEERERVDVVILSCNSFSLPPPGGQDSEGSSSSACDLPLLSHHDQEGTEAPASLSARPGQDRGLNKVCRSRFKGQSAAVLHILSILLLQISNCRKTATELHFHSKQVQGKIIIQFFFLGNESSFYTYTHTRTHARTLFLGLLSSQYSQ